MAYYGSTPINQGAGALGATLYTCGQLCQYVTALPDDKLASGCAQLVSQGLFYRCDRDLLLAVARKFDAIVEARTRDQLAYAREQLYRMYDPSRFITKAGYDWLYQYAKQLRAAGTSGLGQEDNSGPPVALTVGVIAFFIGVPLLLELAGSGRRRA